MSQADRTVNLAADRTRLAYERTMMAWTRTATSLITFGFSIYKFFQIEIQTLHAEQEGPLGSGNFALLMIVIGLTALLIAALDNRRDMNSLKARYPSVKFPRSRARMFSALIAVLGFVALAAVIFRK